MLVMDVLNAMFRSADEWGMLSLLRVPSVHYRVSVYVDDLVIFITSMEADITLLWVILQAFAGASGLHTNVSKCQATLIRWNEEQIALSQQHMPQLVQFPCKYLVVPLLVYALKKADF
jgi:hypothetical protein